MWPWAAPAAPAPWMAPYAASCRRVQAAAGHGGDRLQTLNRALALGPPIALAAGALRFVAQQALPAGEAYESFIARTACVPTRDNAHDAFQALVWLAFPALKRRINELHAAELAARGAGPVRGPVRDALTLLDENGALWSPPASLRDALVARDWHALFVRHRAAWRDVAPPVLVGHALLDKLVQPRKAITAHVWLLPPGSDGPAALAGRLSPAALAERPFVALPVLGVPGWWNANEAAGFYEDRAVFRPPPG